MTKTHDRPLDRLLARHGQTYAQELRIDLAGGGPSALFQLLVAALLMSARISDRVAVAAARALFDHGFRTAKRMLDATWQDRVDALGKGHYVRYDESTATYLGQTAQFLLERYGGDLRRLRDRADRDPQRIHDLLQECKGIGPVGADIFCREAQQRWPELRPFADSSTRRTAADVGLPRTAAGLARRLGDRDLSLVAAALVRARLSDDIDAIRTGAVAPLTNTQLSRMTRKDLYEQARHLDVAGRSSMSRADLAEAVQSAASG